jgi:hypothetical protein
VLPVAESLIAETGSYLLPVATEDKEAALTNHFHVCPAKLRSSVFSQHHSIAIHRYPRLPAWPTYIQKSRRTLFLTFTIFHGASLILTERVFQVLEQDDILSCSLAVGAK